jgi:hypothetical protein
MDGSALRDRVKLTLNEDGAAAKMNRFFLPDSIKFGHPGTSKSPTFVGSRALSPRSLML